MRPTLAIPWAVAGILAGCFEDLQHPSDIVADQLVEGAVHIGALLPLSDGGGLSQRDAVLMAAEDATRDAGITFAIVLADSHPERITGLAGVDTELRRRLELLRRAGAPAVVVADDATAVTARRAGDSRGPVVMSYAASSDAPFDVLRGAPSFRLGPPDSVLGPAIAALASGAQGGVAVLALDGDPASMGLRAAIEAALVAGGDVLIEGAWLDPLAQGGQRERVGPVLARRPGVIIPALPPAMAAAVINEALPMSSARWVLPPTAVSPAFLDNVADPDALDGALAIAPATGSTFTAQFQERTGRSPAPYDSLAYDAVRLLALAAGRTELSDPSGRDLARELPGLDYAGAYTSWRLRGDGRVDSDHPLQVFTFDAATRSFVPRG